MEQHALATVASDLDHARPKPNRRRGKGGSMTPPLTSSSTPSDDSSNVYSPSTQRPSSLSGTRTGSPKRRLSHSPQGEPFGEEEVPTIWEPSSAPTRTQSNAHRARLSLDSPSKLFSSRGGSASNSRSPSVSPRASPGSDAIQWHRRKSSFGRKARTAAVPDTTPTRYVAHQNRQSASPFWFSVVHDLLNSHLLTFFRVDTCDPGLQGVAYLKKGSEWRPHYLSLEDISQYLVVREISDDMKKPKVRVIHVGTCKIATKFRDGSCFLVIQDPVCVFTLFLVFNMPPAFLQDLKAKICSKYRLGRVVVSN